MFARGKRWMKDQLGKTRELIDSIGKSKREGKRNVEFVQIPKKWIGSIGSQFRKHRKHLLITAAGLFGAAWVSGCIMISYNHYVSANTKDVYHIYIDGDQAGTVTDPELVERFLEKKHAEIQREYPGVHMELTADAIVFEHERGFKLSASNSSALDEVEERLIPVATGVELWIDDEVVAVVKDEETLESILNRIESKYLPAGEVSVLSANRNTQEQDEPNMQLEKVEFVEEVKTVPVETLPEVIMDEREVIEMLEQGDTKPMQYVVQAGDTISQIARQFDTTTDFIYEKNPWIKGEFIQIGDTIDLTVEQPALSVRTVEQYEEIETMPFKTRYEDDPEMRVGLSETIQQGRDGEKKVIKELVKVNGYVAERNVVEEVVLKEPVERVVKQGTKVIAGIGTGTFRWPVVSPRVTSGYGQRWGRLHKGIDMVSKNRNILAADHGTVSETGSNDGYGNYIIINHRNGYKTLYGHLSEISVKSGHKVEKGDKIGVMGNTGYSTGVHLHFEIHKNGVAVNPDNYL